MTGIIELPDDELRIVSHMYEYLYTSDYNISPNTIQRPQSPPNPAKRRKCSSGAVVPKKKKTNASTNSESTYAESLITHTKVYILADKYDITPLEELSAQKYKSIAPTHWETPSFAESIGLLYENTMTADRMLRDFVVELAHGHRLALFKSHSFGDLLLSCVEFSYDMLRYSAQHPDTERVSYKCKSCNEYLGCVSCGDGRFFKYPADGQ